MLNLWVLECAYSLIYIGLIKSGGLILHIEARVTSGFIVAVVEAELIVEVVKVAPHPTGFHVDCKLRIRSHIGRNDDKRLAFLVQFARGSFVNLFHGVYLLQTLYLYYISYIIICQVNYM